MMELDYVDFNDWYTDFKYEVRQLGFTGELDKYTFEGEYEDGKTPLAAAKEFVK